MNHSSEQSPDEQALQRLLELRDANTADLAPEDAALVAQLQALREELNGLGTVAVAKDVWVDAVGDLGEQDAPVDALNDGALGGRPTQWLRYPLATAAGVFLVSLVAIVSLFSTDEVPVVPQMAATAPLYDGSTLAGLMRRSRDLERLLVGQGGGAIPAADRSAVAGMLPRQNSGAARSLRYRLADIDTQIARLYDAPVVDEQQRLVLWQQRVEVLRSLLLAQPGAENAFERFDRSM